MDKQAGPLLYNQLWACIAAAAATAPSALHRAVALLHGMRMHMPHVPAGQFIMN
jgi:hypothetical protein